MNLIGDFVRGKGYSVVINFDEGIRILLDLDDWIDYQIYCTGFYMIEVVHSKYFRRSIQDGFIFIDVGANKGYYTLQAANRVGLQGQVHAFEPVTNTFSHLQTNVALNDFTNVISNQTIVHDHSGELEIFIAEENNTGESSIQKPANFSGRSEIIPCITLDEYIIENNINKVDLIKIDVEGSELSVLKGMQNILKREKEGLQLLIEVNESHLLSNGTCSCEIYEYLRLFGFFPYIITGCEEIPNQTFQDDSLVLFKYKET